jgi:hypothetical protein
MNTKQRNRTILILIALILTVSYSIEKVVMADSLQITTEDTYLTAGRENEITIKIKNIGDRSVVGVQAVLTSTTPGISILEGSQKVYTLIADGKTKSYTCNLYVDKSLPLGSYTLTLTVTYQKITFEYVTSIVSVGVVVSEAYTPKLGFNVIQDDISVVAGANNQVTYIFENIVEHKLSDLQFIITSVSPFITVVDDDTIIGDTLLGGETIIINPTVSVLEGTPLTTYTLQASVSFSNEEGDTFFETFILPINVNTALISKSTTITIHDIKIVPETVHPGDIFNLDLNVHCTGANAYDVMSVISFNQISPISPLSPSTVNMGDLEAGSNASVTYSLLISGGASAGQYRASISISYTSSKGIPKILTESVTILVDGLIDFDLLDAPSEVVAPGDISELEADLLLVGTESVDFVSIGVIEDNIIKRVSGSDEYIGAVDPDSPIPFDINYKVDSSAQEQDHELKLNVKYRDHLNREYEEQVSLEIVIGEITEDTPQPQQGGFWVWIRRLLGLGP